MPVQKSEPVETPKDQSVGDTKPETKEVDMEIDSDPRYESYTEEIDWDKQRDKAIQFSMK